jgi:ammonia channel protein AmtB
MTLQIFSNIDDPIGVFAVHWFGGVWGHLTVGLFSENPVPLTTTAGKEGLLMGKITIMY